MYYQIKNPPELFRITNTRIDQIAIVLSFMSTYDCDHQIPVVFEASRQIPIPWEMSVSPIPIVSQIYSVLYFSTEPRCTYTTHSNKGKSLESFYQSTKNREEKFKINRRI
jgi:hypothetical protein